MSLTWLHFLRELCNSFDFRPLDAILLEGEGFSGQGMFLDIPEKTFLTMSTLKIHRLSHQPRVFLISSLIFVLFISVLTTPLQAQDYQKTSRRINRSYYRKQTTLYAHACNLLDRKRHRKPKREHIARSYRENMKSSVLSIDPGTVTADAGETKPQAKPITNPLPSKPKVEEISPEKLADLHQREDQVLKNNNLPQPTSARHEEIRNRVSDKLENKKDIFPLTLDPLYFNFDQDEFSIVDMEPFLIAAEYALQGRTVLIEGHTDKQGNDSYNVKLSIKRVQKIRQLMLDMGVPDDRISVVGYGEELSKEKTNSVEDRQVSRRVDFTIF